MRIAQFLEREQRAFAGSSQPFHVRQVNCDRETFFRIADHWANNFLFPYERIGGRCTRPRPARAPPSPCRRCGGAQSAVCLPAGTVWAAPRDSTNYPPLFKALVASVLVLGTLAHQARPPRLNHFLRFRDRLRARARTRRFAAALPPRCRCGRCLRWRGSAPLI